MCVCVCVCDERGREGVCGKMAILFMAQTGCSGESSLTVQSHLTCLISLSVPLSITLSISLSLSRSLFSLTVCVCTVCCHRDLFTDTYSTHKHTEGLRKKGQDTPWESVCAHEGVHVVGCP